jgi:YesN/AraC family two-component response regulator
MNKQISVIIVDDEEAIIDTVKTALSLNGYHCETAMSGTSALELINKTPFDIMITDIKMPSMNGLELTRKVKELKPDMKVIVMSGFFGNFPYDEAIAMGASDFLEKPFSLRDLIKKIKGIKI